VTGARPTALELSSVTAGYGSTIVLRDVSLAVPAGQIVALLGPNGAGKTTLLRVASGQLPVREGTVRMSGHDVTGRGTHQLARGGLCHVPEGRGVFPSLSVRDNLLLFARRGEERASLERAVAAFAPLGNRLNQLAGSLSGGEQQMLAIVRAYVTDPAVVLVDEASLGLAPLVVDQLYEFLEQVTAEGTALLLVEQYVQRALALADQACLLSQGRIVYSGTSLELEGHDIFEQYLGTTTTL
jgi:branched-chain amino acid transport system ATP-binding protein